MKVLRDDSVAGKLFLELEDWMRSRDIQIDNTYMSQIRITYKGTAFVIKNTAEGGDADGQEFPRQLDEERFVMEED
jgi:hypothetical protein